MSAARHDLPSVKLEPGTLVIADLHLDVGPSGGASESFVTFLRAAHGVPRLVILGDLFDAWIGPAQVEVPAAALVVAALAESAKSGTRIDIVHGNRDFLLERSFEALSGATVHPDGFVGEVGDERWLFVHGDELCTLDRRYQRLKRVLRSRPLLWTVPRLPRSVSLGIAKRLRRASRQAVAAKAPAEKAQQAAEALRRAREAGCATIVVGHAHAFRDERLDGVRWLVLDAFGGPRDLLEVDGRGRLQVRSSRPA